MHDYSSDESEMGENHRMKAVHVYLQVWG